jgi:regulator of sigma E protease
MVTNLYAVVMVALLFGLTVFVHEFGHFLAARWCGLVVDTFSLGFGPALWKRRYRGVTYKIGVFPVGGYVALPQLDPSGTQLVQGSGAAREERHLPPVTPARKILVSLAGGVGNLLLAFALAWVVYRVGKPATPAERSATVGFVHPESLAHARGLRIGDEILSVNGEPVRNWTEFLMACVRYPEVTLAVRSGTERRTLTIPTEKGFFGEQTVRGVDGRSLCMVLSVEPGQSAAQAGLKAGDVIVEFDGAEVISRAQLVDLVARGEGQTHPLKVRRDGEILEREVVPRYDPAADQVRIGIQFNVMDMEFDHIVHPAPTEQIRSHAMAIFRMLAALTHPSQAKAASKAAGGPLAILINLWLLVRISLILAVFFTGLLNVNLAIVNLLPIPVLDGGHILFALWELVFRRPVNATVAGVITNAFAFAIILLFVLLTGRDARHFTPLGRLLDRWLGPPPAPQQAGAPAPVSSPHPAEPARAAPPARPAEVTP